MRDERTRGKEATKRKTRRADGVSEERKQKWKWGLSCYSLLELKPFALTAIYSIHQNEWHGKDTQ